VVADDVSKWSGWFTWSFQGPGGEAQGPQKVVSPSARMASSYKTLAGKNCWWAWVCQFSCKLDETQDIEFFKVTLCGCRQIATLFLICWQSNRQIACCYGLGCREMHNVNWLLIDQSLCGESNKRNSNGYQELNTALSEECWPLW